MIIKKFEEQVKSVGEKIALVSGDRHWTYGMLDQQADRVAREIASKHSPNTDTRDTAGESPRAALLLEHGPDMIIGILAALKAGYLYVPLDTSYPLNRLGYMLAHSQSHLVLTNNKCLPLARQLDSHPGQEQGIRKKPRIVNLDTLDIHTGRENIPRRPSGDSGAYILYTSGSTGNPKGVWQDQGNVLYYIRNWTRRFSISSSDRMSLFSVFSHDGAGQDMFGALLNGATLYPYDIKASVNSLELARWVLRRQITIWHSVPTLYRYFVNTLKSEGEQEEGKTNRWAGRFSHLRLVLLGGEALRTQDIRDFSYYFPHSRLANVYGQTESSVTSIWLVNPQDSFQKVVLGDPLDKTEILVVGDKGNVIEDLGTGEIVVACEHIARGYWQDPESTKAVFFHDPQLGKLYRTGDLGRLKPDGTIEFLGRKDFQIKIRGFRVEVEEIETTLLKHEAIKEAVVVARQRNHAAAAGVETFLCAYTVMNRTLTARELREFLSAYLPVYMIPAYFIFLERMPLTSSNKIDRRALPEPGTGVGGEYTAPKTELEKKLVEIWAGVLAVDKDSISMDASYFQLGGDSLKVMILVARIHKALKVKVPLVKVFQFPTLRGLAEYIKKTAVQEQYISLEPVEKRAYYPLSSAQKRLYILQQMDLSGTPYNLPYSFPLAKGFDTGRLEGMFRTLVARHDSLRTSFQIVEDEPVQRIHDKVEFQIEGFLAPGDTGNAVRPFDLSKAPLLRVGLMENQEGKFLLLIDMHHIITDGSSQGVLIKEFTALYGGEELVAPRLQYKDYSCWQNRPQQRQLLHRQEAYWLRWFSPADQLPILQLPTDYPRPVIKNFAGNSVKFLLSREETEPIRELAKRVGATLYMFLLAAFNVLLAKLSGQEDVIVGTPVAARRHADLDQIIGMFVNTLAMRSYPTAAKIFNAFLNEVKEQTLKAYEYQEYPFEDLVDRAGVRRDTGRNPIFDVMFNLLSLEDYTSSDNSREMAEQVTSEHQESTSKFDLNLLAVDLGEELLFKLEYSSQLFKKQTIERIIGYFRNLVARLSLDPGLTLSRLELITAEEKQEILCWSQGEERVVPGKTLQQRFAEQAAAIPDHIALVGPELQMTTDREFAALRANLNTCGGAHLSYEVLKERSATLAHFLSKSGVGPDTVVGLMMERSTAMMIGILGILKAGGAYLPMDPGYPADRIAFMLNDSKAKLLVTTADLAEEGEKAGNREGEQAGNRESEKVRRWEGEKILLERILDVPLSSTYPHTLLPSYLQRSASLAYIIYTSGSTGRPRGVMVDQRSIVNTLSALEQMYPFQPTDVYLLKTPYLFDVSLTELFGWFWGEAGRGGKLALLAPGGEKEPQQLVKAIGEMGVTHINFVPSMFNVFTSHLRSNPDQGADLSGLKYLFLAGEALLPESVNRFRGLNLAIPLENLYGPSEAAIYASRYPLAEWNGSGPVPIGKPLPKVQLYILDPDDQWQPVGIPGQLAIAGTGLARGYLNNPELTHKKFINYKLQNTNKEVFFGQVLNACGEKTLTGTLNTNTLYQTGDLARWQPEGHIEFLGRIDHQVKIRGFRIELGEIEGVLCGHDNIKEAVVTALGDEYGDRFLCAYIVVHQEVGDLELKEYLARHLPDYMIPPHLVTLEQIPLTSSGKVDRNGLPAPGVRSGEVYIAPRDRVEKKLVEIWAEVLGRDPGQVSQLRAGLGIDDRFFDLGGHSLKATVMISKIHRELKVKVPLAVIFKTPSIRGLSKYIEEAGRDGYISLEPGEKREYYPLSSAQKRLYVIQQADKSGTAYNIPVVVVLSGHLDRHRLDQAFQHVLARHESFRTSFATIGGLPVQRIHNKKAVAGGLDDSRGGFSRKEPPWSPEAIITDCLRPFDLSRAPLLRVELIRLEQTKHLLIVDMHHIISDGISMEIVTREFMLLYGGRSLLPLRLQYRDFSGWQHSQAGKEVIREQERFWLDRFRGEIPDLDLPYDYPRPLKRTFAGSSLGSRLDPEETQALKKLAKAEDVTLFMLVLAIYNVLLSQLSWSEDIVVGTPVSGRRHDELRDTIGMFVNTLALRNYPSGEKTFGEFLEEIKTNTLEAFENQLYPFADLVEKIAPSSDKSRNPLFDVLLTFREVEMPSIEIPGLKSGYYEYKQPVSRFDLTLFGVQREGILEFTFEYSTALFKEETIQRFLDYLRDICRMVVAEPGIRLNRLEFSPGLADLEEPAYEEVAGDFGF